MYMAMLVALTLAFPSCNVEMELGIFSKCP